MYVLVEDGIVKSVQLDKKLVPLAIEGDNDLQYGDLYDGVTFTKLPREVIPIVQVYDNTINGLTLEQYSDWLKWRRFI